MNSADAYLDLLEKVILNEINPENGARIRFLVGRLTSGVSRKYSRNKVLSALVSLHRSSPSRRKALANLHAPRNWWTNTLGFPFSMIGPKRLRNVREAAETVFKSGVHGVMIETGVWRGGACLMMKGVMRVFEQVRPLYLCDSFQGLPTVNTGPDKDLKLDENPILAASLEDVRSHFARLDLLDDDVHFIQGWFKDTMPGVSKEVADQGIAILRLDGDYYTSTMEVLEALYPHMSPGGFLIVDDYHTYQQCRQATDEYRAAHGITDTIQEIDGAGVFWRVSAPASLVTT